MTSDEYSRIQNNQKEASTRQRQIPRKSHRRAVEEMAGAVEVGAAHQAVTALRTKCPTTAGKGRSVDVGRNGKLRYERLRRRSKEGEGREEGEEVRGLLHFPDYLSDYLSG